jgi:hypothetical protein
MKKDTMASFVGLFLIVGTTVYSCNERDDLESEVSDLESDVDDLKRKWTNSKRHFMRSKMSLLEIESEYIEVDFNLGRLSYDDWRDVVK